MDVSEYTKDRIPELRNLPVYDTDGDELGKVGDAYYDEDTGRLEAVAVAGDALGFSKRVVPVQGATIDDRGIHLGYSGGDVQGAPDFDDDDDFDRVEERYAGVSDYYGGLRGSESGTVTRSEEELRVGKEQVEAGRVRLRKWVETEGVETDVELRRETARVTREPVNEVVSGAELGEDVIEVPLHEERPVVQKEVVARERVGLETGVETEVETVSDQVRKERVDVEGDVDAR